MCDCVEAVDADRTPLVSSVLYRPNTSVFQSESSPAGIGDQWIHPSFRLFSVIKTASRNFSFDRIPCFEDDGRIERQLILIVSAALDQHSQSGGLATQSC